MFDIDFVTPILIFGIVIGLGIAGLIWGGYELITWISSHLSWIS